MRAPPNYLSKEHDEIRGRIIRAQVELIMLLNDKHSSYQLTPEDIIWRDFANSRVDVIFAHLK